MERQWLLPRNSEPSWKRDHNRCGQPVLMEYLLSLIPTFYLYLCLPGSWYVPCLAGHLQSFPERANVLPKLWRINVSQRRGALLGEQNRSFRRQWHRIPYDGTSKSRHQGTESFFVLILKYFSMQKCTPNSISNKYPAPPPTITDLNIFHICLRFLE